MSTTETSTRLRDMFLTISNDRPPTSEHLDELCSCFIESYRASEAEQTDHFNPTGAGISSKELQSDGSLVLICFKCFVTSASKWGVCFRRSSVNTSNTDMMCSWECSCGNTRMRAALPVRSKRC